MYRHCFLVLCLFVYFWIFFFNDTATTEIYTLSLHDALPISPAPGRTLALVFDDDGLDVQCIRAVDAARAWIRGGAGDRKSTRLNSSHGYISYAVFCLKKKKQDTMDIYLVMTLLITSVKSHVN